MSIVTKDTNFIVSPDNRIYEYLLFCDFVFKKKTIFFTKDLNKLDINNSTIFLDVKYLKKFNKYQFKNNNFEIYIFLWNSNIDYLNFENEINLIKKKFINLKIIFLSNFNIQKNKYLLLDDFPLSKSGYLKNIKGISYLKKIKYKYPLIFSIYNFIKYLPRSLNFLNERLVFVGLADNEDVYEALSYIINSPKSIFRSDEMKRYCQMILKEFKTQKSCFELSHLLKISDFNMHVDEIYYILNLIIRNLLINYLKNFKVFSFKNKSNDAFELLKTNLYKKIIHLDVGSLSGNSNNYPRSILLHRFYKKKSIRINFFDPNVTYDNKILKIQINKIISFFDKLYKFNDYDCNLYQLKHKLVELNNFLIKN